MKNRLYAVTTSLLLSLLTTVNAAIITVSNTNDLVNAPSLFPISLLTNNDGGDGVSLREAITAANITAGADSINFSALFDTSQTIVLTSGFVISTPMTITGPSANLLTVDAGNGADDLPNTQDGYRILDISDGTVTQIAVVMSGLTLSGADTNGSGGAIKNNENLTLTDIALSGNAANSGGGIYNHNGTMTVSNSTISGNSATYGGGIYSNTNLSGQVTAIRNVTISGNSADGNGGGLYNVDGLTVIQFSTITDNTAANNRGSGIASWGDNLTRTEISHSIVAGNTNEDVAVVGSPSNNSFQSNGFNLIGNGAFFNAGSSLDNFNQTGDQINIANPMLGSLADNGGITQTHSLLAGSPALDAGDPTVVAGVSDIPLFDQRGTGYSRVQFGRIDIGAFEVQPLDFCPSALQIDGFTTIVSNPDELIQAMECSNINGSGADTIELSSDIILIVEYENHGTFGRTGTPAITSALVIDGKGFTLQRDSSVACVFNGTEDLGEFRILRITASADLTLQNLTIAHGCADGNSAFGRFGGGLLNDGALSLINTTFDQNLAGLFGGALYHKNGTISEISYSTFSGNSSGERGGAIDNESTINTIQNSTFSDNSTDIEGGAIHNRVTITTIQNSTFSGNSAGRGEAIFNIFANINLMKNSLFHNNGSNDCNGIVSTFNGSNNISTQTSANSGCPGIIATSLTANTLGALVDNGGPTMTHALLVGSEALDNAVGGTNTDQRGFGLNGVRDIGAYEVQVIELCPIDLLADGFTTIVSNPAELIQAMECSNVNGSGADTIELSSDITLITAYENSGTYGKTGAPPITSAMTIDGKGFILKRDNSVACAFNEIDDIRQFRILRTTVSADLTLQNLTVAHGCTGAFIPNDNAKQGGGLYNDGALSVINTTFDQNRADRFGGAIYHNSGILSEISYSIFSGNSAIVQGGAIYNFSMITTIQNSTFSGNSANGNGGAIYNALNSNINTIQNNTFSSNSAQIGGVIFSAMGDINLLQNSLFHNNGSNDCTGTISGNNNISNQTSANSGCPGIIATPLTANTLGALADNGGPTMTHALLVGSAALDNAIGGTSTDQRGFGLDGVRDIGAYEAQVPVVTAPVDISLEATGVTTAVVLGTPTVTDVDESGLTASADMASPFAVGVHTVTWSAVDSQGHTASDTQTVTIVDTTPPVISLVGNASVVTSIGAIYKDVGATALDLVDGDLIASINTNNPVNTAIAGMYTVTYDVADNAGNNATQVTRLVQVQAHIGGNVSGLIDSNTVTISDGFQSLTLGNSTYTFNKTLNFGDNYFVNITAQPNGVITQTCEISNNSGTISTSDISNINVVCELKKYYVGGEATGLVNGDSVILNLGVENLLVDENAAFVFLMPIADNTQYAITIDTPPMSSSLSCALVNATGTIAGDDVIDVELNCFGIIFKDGFEDEFEDELEE